MRIQHNMKAKNAYRNYKQNTARLSKNMEKLSSGYRINRAGDDAAGLAISEKMRAQITGLNAAQNNVQDGISLIKTAEGAMQEIQDMLNRMAYLATQSANATYDDAVDRAVLQEEVDALLKEIDRIHETANFNGMPLLLGDDVVERPPVATVSGGLPDWVVQPAAAHMAQEITKNYNYTDNTVTPPVNKQQMVTHAAAILDFSQFDATNKQDLLGDNVGFYSTCCTCQNHYSIQFVDGDQSTVESSGQHYIYKIGIGSVTTAEGLVNAIINGTGGNPNNHYTKLEAGSSASTLVIYDNRSKTSLSVDQSSWTNWSGLGAGQSASPDPDNGYGIYGEGVAYEYVAAKHTGQDIILQIGDTADESNQLLVHLPDMSLGKIGVKSLSVNPADNARAAIPRLKTGINYVSSERGRMGAYQNRLEHTQDNLSVMEENIQKAESLIRDTDIAEEMTSYTKNNILIQSAQAMLAQANQSPQSVLQLMQ